MYTNPAASPPRASVFISTLVSRQYPVNSVFPLIHPGASRNCAKPLLVRHSFVHNRRSTYVTELVFSTRELLQVFLFLINAPYHLLGAPIVELHHQDCYHIQLVCESTYQDFLHYHHLHHFFSLSYRRYTAGCTWRRNARPSVHYGMAIGC